MLRMPSHPLTVDHYVIKWVYRYWLATICLQEAQEWDWEQCVGIHCFIALIIIVTV